MARLSARASLVVVLLTGIGCAGRYERGMKAIEEQRFEEAKREAQLGRSEEPSDPRYDLLMAEALVKEAMTMSQATSDQSEGPPLELKKVQRRYNEALPYARRALDSGRLNAEAGATARQDLLGAE